MPPKSRKAKQTQLETVTKSSPQEKPEKESDTNTNETRSKVLQPREVNKKVDRPVSSSQRKNDTRVSESAASKKSQTMTRSRSTSNTTATSISTTTTTTKVAQTTEKTTFEKNKSTVLKEKDNENDSNVAGNIKKTSVNYITATASNLTPTSASTSPPTPVSAFSSTAAFTTPPNSTTITTTPPGFRNPPTPASKSPIKTVDPRALINNPISPVTPTPFTFSFPITGRGSSLALSQGGHSRTASQDSTTTNKAPKNTHNNFSNGHKAAEGPVPKSEIVILGKFVALSKSFAELEQRIAGEFMGPKMATIATDSTTKDEKQQQPANAEFRVHHSLHRLLSLVRSGSIEQQEAAYKICVNQWVFLARGPGFPDDEDKAYVSIDQHFTTTGTAPLTAKTRINALIHFLNGARLAFVLARSHQPFVSVNKSPAGKSGNSTTTKNGNSKAKPSSTQKIPQHPEMASGNYTRLAMDKDGKPRFVCIVNGCQRSYASGNCLQRHQVQHFELYACPACPQTFYSRTDHIQKHWENCHPNRPRRDLEKTLELMYRNGGAPPALKMWVNGVVWSRKQDGNPRRRNMKRKHLDALRSTEREGYVAQKASWEVLKGLKIPEQDEQRENDEEDAQGKRRKENEYQVQGVGEHQGESVQARAQQA